MLHRTLRRLGHVGIILRAAREAQINEEFDDHNSGVRWLEDCLNLEGHYD